MNLNEIKAMAADINTAIVEAGKAERAKDAAFWAVVQPALELSLIDRKAVEAGVPAFDQKDATEYQYRSRLKTLMLLEVVPEACLKATSFGKAYDQRSPEAAAKAAAKKGPKAPKVWEVKELVAAFQSMKSSDQNRMIRAIASTHSDEMAEAIKSAK
jgi:hypothetical protein